MFLIDFSHCLKRNRTKTIGQSNLDKLSAWWWIRINRNLLSYKATGQMVCAVQTENHHRVKGPSVIKRQVIMFNALALRVTSRFQVETRKVSSHCSAPRSMASHLCREPRNTRQFRHSDYCLNSRLRRDSRCVSLCIWISPTPLLCCWQNTRVKECVGSDFGARWWIHII